MNVTREMIEALRIEAGEHGDEAQVALCAAALEGDASAWAKCVDAIEYARSLAAGDFEFQQADYER